MQQQLDNITGVLLYFGNPQNIEAIKNRYHFLKDIVIGYIKIDNEQYEADIELPWNELLVNGYAHARNIVDTLSPTDWCMVVTASKQVEIDFLQVQNKAYKNRYSIIQAHNGDEQRWNWLYRKSSGEWKGVIHEVFTQTSGNVLSAPLLKWEKIEVKPTEYNIYKFYRDMSRIKWLIELRKGNYRDSGTNEIWWSDKAPIDWEELEMCYNQFDWNMVNDKDLFTEEYQRAVKDNLYIYVS